MKNFSRKSISVLLALLLTFSVFGIVSFAEGGTGGYYTVTFKSWDGNTVLKEETVAEGGDATPPEIPARMSDADYHYTPGEWTGYTNITAAMTLLAPYTAEEHSYSGYNCSVCGRLNSNSMVVHNYYNNYVTYHANLLAFIQGSEVLFRQALSDHGLSVSAYTDAGDALRAKAKQDMGEVLSVDAFCALGKDDQWHINRFNGIKSELQAGLDEIVNLGVFSKTKEEQTKAAEELAEPGDSIACETLIATAQAAIAALEYDRNQSLDDNVAAVKAVVTALEADLTVQRVAELAASKEVLSDLIGEARGYYDTLLEDEKYAQIADDLDTKLQQAEAILSSDASTTDEINGAADMVFAALEAAKEQKAAADEAEAPDEGESKPHGDFCFCYAVSGLGKYDNLIRSICAIVSLVMFFLNAVGAF